MKIAICIMAVVFGVGLGGVVIHWMDKSDRYEARLKAVEVERKQTAEEWSRDRQAVMSSLWGKRPTTQPCP